MQLQTSATQVDFYPVGTNPKRFVKRTIWHPGSEGMTTFSTVVKSDARYDITQYITNRATVTDFNILPQTDSDYSPVYC